MQARINFLKRTPRKTPAELQELEAWGQVVRRLEDAVEALSWMEAEAFWRVRLRQEPPEVVALDLGVSARWCRELARRGREKVEKTLADRKGALGNGTESKTEGSQGGKTLGG